MIIDADAHVVETVHTWDYLEGSDKKYRPQLFRSEDNPSTQYWFLDGKSIGFRNPTLSEQELLALSKETGRTLQTDADARELRDVELRLQHMDKLGIDVQILFNTMWIARVADKAETEVALCASWNRWMADVWKQGKNRLRWSCVVPRWAFVEASAQWVPWVVNEAVRRSGTKGFPKNPCKEFQIYINAQTDDDFAYVLKYAGEDNIVIGTDYGHTDASSEVDAIEVFRKNDTVSAAVKKKILDDNPRTLYGL